MPALETSSHWHTIEAPVGLETSKKKAVSVPISGTNFSLARSREQSRMDLDFGAYLRSASPPVNFAFSYSIDYNRGKPGGLKSQPWMGQSNGNTIKINNDYDLSNDFQRMNRCSADRGDIANIRGDSPQRRDFRDASPSIRTKQSGYTSNGGDSLYRSSNRSKKSTRSCLRTHSLYDLQGDSAKDSSQIKRDNRLSRKVSFADDIGRRLCVVRIFEESPDVPSFSDPSRVLRNSQMNGSHLLLSSKTYEHFRSNANSLKSLSSSFREANGNTPCSSSSPALCDSFAQSSATSSSSISSSSEVEISGEGLERCLLVPNFSMPAASYKSFRRKIEDQCVSLESVHQTESTGNLCGTIKVRELAYEKQALVRVTFDGWQTHTDVEAEYVVPTDAASLRGRVLPFATFSFSFSLPSNSFQVARHGVQFAVCYRSAGKELWDNNSGCNYEFKSPDWAGPGLMTSSTGRRGLHGIGRST